MELVILEAEDIKPNILLRTLELSRLDNLINQTEYVKQMQTEPLHSRSKN